MNISISRDGVEIGEWSQEDVVDFYKKGQLVETDLYWKEGMKEWQPLIGLIKPPLPPSHSIKKFDGLTIDYPKTAMGVSEKTYSKTENKKQPKTEGFITVCFVNVIKKTFVFKGRSGRKEFWGFHLIFWGSFWLWFGATELLSDGDAKSSVPGVMVLIALPFFLLFAISSYALWFRRLHDVDQTGLWIFIPIVPWIMVFFKGSVGENCFGLPPLQKNKH